MSPRQQSSSLFSRELMRPALLASLRKLDPRVQLRNPVMFVVEVGAVLTTVRGRLPDHQRRPVRRRRRDAAVHHHGHGLAVADRRLRQPRRGARRGPRTAQADTLRAMRTETVAHLQDGTTRPASELHRGDVVVVEAGEVIPGDGTVIEGIASVDESAITGESAPVIRESGGDRSAVTGGTRVLSDRIVVEITQEPGQSFLDRMIALVEGAERRKTPNEIALNILLAALTLIFVIVVVTLQPFAHFANTDISITTLIALLVALIPTTIGALLSAIGIAGMDRLVRRNVLALSGRAVEASGDVDVLLLDKTGTITLGNRQASEFVPMPGVAEAELAEAAQLSSLADETPEGRSIVVLAKQYGLREHEMVAAGHAAPRFVPFTAQTRMSGVDYDGTHAAQGRRRRDRRVGARRGRHDAGRARRRGRPHRPRGRHAAGRRAQHPGARRHLPQGHGQGGHGHALRPPARDGHPHGHGHRRQHADRGQDRRGGRRRRLPGRGHARAQDGAHPRRAGRGPAGGDDRRRHQRRARAGPGRRRRGDEHRHPGRARGGQHGRPRLQPDEAHRDRRGRQAAAHHARRADHVLDRQRRREVLRDPAGDLRLHLRRPRAVSAARSTR